MGIISWLQASKFNVFAKNRKFSNFDIKTTMIRRERKWEGMLRDVSVYKVQKRTAANDGQRQINKHIAKGIMSP